MCKKIILSLLILSGLNADAEEINSLPIDYMSIQHAGYVGYIGVGTGNMFFDEHYELELYMGITPRTFDISEVTIYSFTVKNNYVPYVINYEDFAIKPYIGAGLIFGLNNRYDPNWQDSIHKGYYYQNNFHLINNIGISVTKKFTDTTASSISSFGLYAEAVAIDVDIQNYFKNDGTLKLNDIYTWSVGLRVGF